MTPKFLLSPIAISLGLISCNLSAEEIRDWSGSYVGGMIGYSNTKASSKATVNEFNGDVYDSMNSIIFSQGNLSKIFDLPSLTNLSSLNDGSAQGALLIGKNFQNEHIVFGGELRASFGNFGATSSFSSQGTGSLVGNDFEGFTFSMTNQNAVLDGNTSPQTYYGFADFSGSYEQQISQTNNVDFNNVNSMIGRLGWADGSFLWYLAAGVNYSRLHATTQTAIVESGSGTLTPSFGGEPLRSFDGTKSYLFSGEHHKGMIGYTLGAGLDWAINEKLILRVEGEYKDLGNISVTGTSNQTAYTYTLKQGVSGYNLATGLIYKF